MADPAVQQLISRVAALEQRLTQQLRGSIGVSTGNAGALNIRTTQLGFRGETTSTFDATDGYSWKRSKLVPPAYVDPGVQLTGNKAFTVGNNETLPSGTAGWFEPSPDGVGYVFTVDPSATAGHADCSVLLGNLRSGSCFTLTIAAGVGSCSCIETQSTAMIWDDTVDAAVGSDLIYGCPPGVVTTWCPDGAPMKYKIVVAGFTGGSAVLNGTYTLTWSSGETWTGITAGVTATLIQTADGQWQLGITDGTYVPTWFITGITDCCSNIVLELDDNGSTTDPPATLTAEVVTACGLGIPYYAYLDSCSDSCGRPSPRLRLIPVTASGQATITFGNAGCTADGSGQFSTSDPIFCTADPDGACGTNSVSASVVCGCGDVPPVVFDECPVGISTSACVTVTELLGLYPELDAVYEADTVLIPGTSLIGLGALCAFNGEVWASNYGVNVIVECRPAPEDPTKFSLYLSFSRTFPPVCNIPWNYPTIRLTAELIGGVPSGTYYGNIAANFAAYNSPGCGPETWPYMSTVLRAVVQFNAACTPSGPSCGFTSDATFNCLDSGSCVDPGDGTGEFTGATAEADCIAECGGGGGTDCAALDGLTGSVVIPAGRLGGGGGVIAATWTYLAPNATLVALALAGYEYTFTCSDGGYLYATLTSGGGQTMPGSVVDPGPPQIQSYDGGTMPGSGAITVTTS